MDREIIVAACPHTDCKRLCGPGDCECPPCDCPGCEARTLFARTGLRPKPRLVRRPGRPTQLVMVVDNPPEA